MKPLAHSLHAAVDRRWLLPLAIGSALSLLLLVALTTFPSSSAPPSAALFVEHKLSPTPPSAASPPRIAFLISGSAGDASALYHPRNRYILHLDAEAPDSDRRTLAADLSSHPAIAAAANVRVVDRANLVTYRGPTMVANTLHAAAAFLWGHAGDGGSHWDWFINLSASDYPLVTQDDLIHVFSKLPRDLNFIDHTSDIGWKEFQRAKPVIIDPGLYMKKKADVFWIPQRRSVPTAFKLFAGSFSMMMSIKDIPMLTGENYPEWHRKLELFFIMASADWILTAPRPTEPVAPVRADTDTDTTWRQKEQAHEVSVQTYETELAKWEPANKKAMALVSNTIDPAIGSSFGECASVMEYLEKIKSQFTGSSKTYGTQLIQQLFSEKYTGGSGGLRAHINKLVDLNNKLKPMDLDFKENQVVHLIFASLPKEFEPFVLSYNVNPEGWNIDKTMNMCVQEEQRLKALHGGSINYVNAKKKNPQSPRKPQNKGEPSSKGDLKRKAPAHQQHKPSEGKFVVDKDQCLYCKERGHYKSKCPEYMKYLKSQLAQKGVQFDENHGKKRRTD